MLLHRVSHLLIALVGIVLAVEKEQEEIFKEGGCHIDGYWQERYPEFFKDLPQSCIPKENQKKTNKGARPSIPSKDDGSKSPDKCIPLDKNTIVNLILKAKSCKKLE